MLQMGEADITRKIFLLVGHSAGGSKNILREDLTRLCQAQRLSMGSLTASDGLAFIQAVANGCQVIVLEESVPECPAAASFAATAALSGYGLTIVTGSGKHEEAGMQRQLGHQGSGTSVCKLLCMRPGQEALLAAVVLAPILFRETIFGQPHQHSAGGLQSASAQPQQAGRSGPAPLMLAGPPQEAADASSGQTQQILKTAPQHCNRHEQQRGADEAGGLPSSADMLNEPKDARHIGMCAAQPDQCGGPGAAGRGAACFEAFPADDGPRAGQQGRCGAELPRSGVGQPADEQTEVVDLISDSDDDRAGIPVSRTDVQRNGQPNPPLGGQEEASQGRAVRRSTRISSQCNSDASASEEEHRRIKRSKTWLKGCKKRQAEAHPPKPKKSRLGRAQQAPVDAPPRQGKPQPVRAKAAAAGGKRAVKPRMSRAETQLQQQKKQAVRQVPGDTKADAPAKPGAASQAAEVPQGESSDWSSEPEGADQSLEQDVGVAQSSKAAVNIAHAHAAKGQTVDPPSSAARSAGIPAAVSPQLACKTEVAGNSAAPVPHATGKSETTEAVAPSPAPGPGSSPAKSMLPFSQADVGALLAAFQRNRCSQAASQSPAKKYKWADKGKQKASDVPRDPQQPGPSDAVYCTPAEEVEDSDDDSFDLNTPLI